MGVEDGLGGPSWGFNEGRKALTRHHDLCPCEHRVPRTHLPTIL